MMIDFKKLNDPEFRAQAERRREAAEQAQHKLELKHRAAVRLLTLHEQIYAALSVDESNFVRNAERRLNAYSGLTSKQHDWLLGLADRHGMVFDSVPGIYAFRDGDAVVVVDGPGAAHVTPYASADALSAWANERGLSAIEINQATSRFLPNPLPASQMPTRTTTHLHIAANPKLVSEADKRDYFADVVQSAQRRLKAKNPNNITVVNGGDDKTPVGLLWHGSKTPTADNHSIYEDILASAGLRLTLETSNNGFYNYDEHPPLSHETKMMEVDNILLVLVDKIRNGEISISDKLGAPVHDTTEWQQVVGRLQAVAGPHATLDAVAPLSAKHREADSSFDPA